MDFDGDSSHMLLDAYGTSCLLDQVQNDIRNYDEVRLLSEKLIRLNLSALQAKKNRKLPPTPEWILRRNIYHAVLSSSTFGKLQTSDTSVLVKLSRIIYTSERIDIPGCFHDAYKPIVKIFKHRYK